MKLQKTRLCITIVAILAMTSISMTSNAQLGGILNRVKDRAADKVLEKVTKQKESATDSGNSETNQESDVDSYETSSPKLEPIIFPVTGKVLNAAVLEYGMDIERDIEKMATTSTGQELSQIGRNKGLTGTNKDILMEMFTNPTRMNELFGDGEQEQYEGIIPEDIKLPPSLLMGLFIGAPIYTFTSDYTRAEMRKAESGTSIMDMFGMQPPITVIDLKNRVSYSIMNIFDIKAAIKNSINNSTNEIGFTDYFLKIRDVSDAKIIKRNDTFESYNCTVHSIEVQVKEGKDENGKPDHSLYQMHTMLSGDMEVTMPQGNVRYSPEYKLFIEAYFSNDLDGELPSRIESNMEQAQKNSGIMVAYILKDEKGNEAVYKLKKVSFNQSVDQGQFQIPEGFQVMTQADFEKAMKSKFSIGNMLKRGLTQ